MMTFHLSTGSLVTPKQSYPSSHVQIPKAPLGCGSSLLRSLHWLLLVFPNCAHSLNIPRVSSVSSPPCPSHLICFPVGSLDTGPGPSAHAVLSSSHAFAPTVSSAGQALPPMATGLVPSFGAQPQRHRFQEAFPDPPLAFFWQRSHPS